jgi:DNA polymerase III delta prime subunit
MKVEKFIKAQKSKKIIEKIISNCTNVEFTRLLISRALKK